MNLSAQLKTKIDNLQLEIDAVQGKTSSIEAEIHQNEERLTVQNKQLQEAKAEFDKHNGTNENIEKELENLERAYGNRKNEF
jgi:chromosome segregation ATPase